MTATARPLLRRARRLLATLALVAQWVAMAAPLVDVHPPAPIVAVSATAQFLGDAGLPGGDQHDASRCPGCIAQLIHAAPAPTTRIELQSLERLVAPEARAGTAPATTSPNTLHSRAPPLRG